MNLSKSMQPPKYRFYPSLLDKFEKYLHVDREFENIFNQDRETGDYKRSFEEIEAELKQSLIDSINRIPFDSEAADKGTAFNEIVDSLIHNRRSTTVQMKGDFKNDTITAVYNNRTFVFSYRFCCKAAEYFHGSVSQVLVKALLDTSYGLVELCGYIDELNRNKVYDIKTTGRYEFGKYEHGWQRYVYPYCLVETGLVTEIEAFEYTAYLLKGGTGKTPIITGIQYPELYKYDHEESRALLRTHSERFIEFLETNRALITDKKIFGII